MAHFRHQFYSVLIEVLVYQIVIMLKILPLINNLQQSKTVTVLIMFLFYFIKGIYN